MSFKKNDLERFEDICLGKRPGSDATIGDIQAIIARMKAGETLLDSLSMTGHIEPFDPKFLAWRKSKGEE